MKKDNKGFTLVELLIVIAVMLSITAIGVVTFININKTKKQEAYEDVQKQVEGAAEQYFGTNEYVISDMEDGGEIEVGVGKLVAEDYMNTVVNPVTGDKLNVCDKVIVEKNGTGYKYTYKEDDTGSTNPEDCDGGNVITVREAGAPKIGLKNTSGPTGSNGWYNTAVMTKLTAETNNNGPLIEVKYCYGNGSCNYNIAINSTSDSDVIYDITNNDIDSTNIVVKAIATNNSGKTATTEITYKKDTVVPTFDVVLSKNGDGSGYLSGTWSNDSIFTKVINQQDETSGVDYTKYTTTGKTLNETKTANNRKIFADGESNIKYIVYDKAGNSSDISNNVKIDKTPPTCELKFEGTMGKTQKVVGEAGKKKLSDTTTNTDWYISDVNIDITASDSLSGVNTKTINYDKNKYNAPYVFTEETKGITIIGEVKDNAGNSKTCSKTIKLDKTPPVLTGYDGGRVYCGEVNFGFTVSLADNFNSTSRLLEYYSSIKCDTFYWASSSLTKENNGYHTIFSKCGESNPKPGARFQAYDEAGNRSDIVEISFGRPAANSSISKEIDCDSTKKWDESPNKGK